MDLDYKNIKQKAQELLNSKKITNNDRYLVNIENFLSELANDYDIHSEDKTYENPVNSKTLIEENEELKRRNQDYLNINEELIQTNVELLESRKIIEEEKDRIQNLLKDLNDSQSIAKIGNWKWFVPENRVEWSNEMHKIFGVDQETFNGDLAFVMSNCIHPEDRAKVEKINQIIAEKGEAITIEYRIILPDNSIKYIWAKSGEIKKDDKNQVYYSSGIVQDISDRKVTEMKLLQMTDNLRAQAEVMEYAHILIRDMENQIVYWNKGMETLYGWSRNEIMNKVTHQLFQTKFPIPYDEYQRILFEKSSWEGELTHITKSGKTLIVASHHSIFYNSEGKPQLIIEVNNDITNQKQVEQRLLENEIQLKIRNEEYAAINEEYAATNEEYLTTNEELLQSNQELYALKEQLEETIKNLKQTNADLQKSQKIAKIGSWKWNIVEDKLEWSDEMFNIFEIDKEVFTGNLGQVMLSRIHPEDLKKVEEVNRLVLEEGTPKPLEYRLLLPGNRLKTVWAEAAELQKSKNGKPILLTGIVHDITEWRKTIDDLKESELRFSAIFQKSPIGISLMNMNTGAHVAVNEANLKIFGFAENEILNRTSLELNVYENPYERNYFLRKLKSEGRLQNEEITIRKKSGAICTVQTSVEKITIAGEDYLLIMMSDITEHKKSEEKVKSSERNLKLFVEYAPAAIAMFDNQMQYLIVSKRFLADYNLKEQNIIGKSHYEVFPEITEYWKDIHNRCLQGATEKNDEDFFLRTNGEIDWMKWEIHPWYENSKKIGGILLFSEVITERKKAETALKVSEEKFRNLFETIQVGIIFQNEEGQIQMMNQAAEKILETDLDHVNNTLDLLLQNALKENGQLMEKKEFPAYLSLKTGNNISNVLIHFVNPKSKRKKWLNTSSIPIINQETGKQFVYTIFEDISEQVKFNNESRKLHTAFAQSSSSFIITDIQGLIEDINSQTEKVSGYSREEIIGKTPALFKSGIHDTIFYENMWKTISLGNTWEGQICNKHKNGSLYWAYSVISPIKNENGSITHYFSTQNDITELKRDREELNKYREQLEIIIEERTKEIETVSSKLLNLIYSMPLGYIETDYNGYIISFNNYAEYIFGIKSKELIGKEISQIFNFTPDVKLMLQSSKDNVNVFVHVHHMNQKQISCRWNVVNLYDKYTGKLGKAFIIEDISKMKEAERSLHAALEKEKELNELKSGFVSMTSHQFRTPLTTILSNTELIDELISELKEDEKLKGKRYAKRIYDNIERLNLLMSDVLMVGKTHSGKIVFRPQIIHLSDFVQKLISDTRFPYQNDRTTELIIEGKEKELSADPNLLAHIIHNLLSNAFKYSKEDAKLHITFFEKTIRIMISDKGIGIPPEDQNKLFNSFFRASNTENLTGTGLGLVIVKEYVEMHKGSISFMSEINKGSDFIVEIPYM